MVALTSLYELDFRQRSFCRVSIVWGGKNVVLTKLDRMQWDKENENAKFAKSLFEMKKKEENRIDFIGHNVSVSVCVGNFRQLAQNIGSVI